MKRVKMTQVNFFTRGPSTCMGLVYNSLVLMIITVSTGPQKVSSVLLVIHLFNHVETQNNIFTKKENYF